MPDLDTLAVAVERDPYVIGGLVIPFGSRDLDDEFFDSATDLSLDWFPAEGRPILFHHGLNNDVRTEVVGRQIGKSIDAAGVWITAQLDRRSKYVEHVRALLAKGALGWSSGAMSHLVRVLKDSGRIVSWPWVEASLTTTPSNPGAFVYSVKSTEAIAHLRTVGTALPAALTVSRPYQAEFAALHERVSRPTPNAQAVLDESLRLLAEDPIGAKGVVDEALRSLERAELDSTVARIGRQDAERAEKIARTAARTRDAYDDAREARRGI